MANLFGGGIKLIPSEEHPRGREIALTDAAKNELAEVQARLLVNWKC